MEIEKMSALHGRVAPAVISPGSAVPRVRRPSVRARRRNRGSVRTCRQQMHESHVISEDLFKGVLTRERKRSDRSNQAFVLLLVATADFVGGDPPLAWKAVVAAVAAAKRETDVLGWFKQQSVLGVILPDVDARQAVATDLEARVRQELSTRLDQATAARFSVRLHAHAPARPRGESGFQPIDPVLQRIDSRNDKAAVYDVIKRGLDIVGSLALLTLLSPLLLLIAALVRFRSPGPVFLKQVRVGQKAKPFTMLKFRTMHVNADAAVHQQYVSWFIKASGQTQEPGKSSLFKIANDPRVTPIGRILRKTSLDELPQLWNVLRGEMSLVGPRPPLQYEVEQYEPWHYRRVLEAKPGITGLWQVAGRSRTTFDEMVRLDLRYARTYSLWTDIKILLATPAAVISGKGAC